MYVLLHEDNTEGESKQSSSNIMPDSSNNKGPHQVPSVAVTSYQLGTKMQPNQVSSASQSDDGLTFERDQFSRPFAVKERPRRVTFMELEDRNLKPSKSVKFSEYSSIRVYPTHEIEKEKSFKSADIKMFKAQANRDVSRVAKLIAACPHNGGMAIYHLIDIGVLKVEDLVGIEQFICGKNAATNIVFERFAHCNSVRRKQRDMNVLQLAYLAAKQSSRNTIKAVQRARLAETGTEAYACTPKHCQLKSKKRCRRS